MDPQLSRGFTMLGIDHVVLRVRDLDAMRRFYVDVLGGSIDRAQPDIGLYAIRAGLSLIDLVPVDGPIGREGGAAPGREGHNLDHFCLRVDPFDAAAIEAWLRSHGIAAEPAAKRYGADGSGWSIYLNDPEGNRVELKGPPF